MFTSRTFTLFRSLHFQPHKAAQPWLHKTTSKPDLPLSRTHTSKPWHRTGLNKGYATLTAGSGDEASHRIWDGNTNGNISNDQVARLAARRLHPLALGDLVRYVEIFVFVFVGLRGEKWSFSPVRIRKGRRRRQDMDANARARHKTQDARQNRKTYNAAQRLNPRTLSPSKATRHKTQFAYRSAPSMVTLLY